MWSDKSHPKSDAALIPGNAVKRTPSRVWICVQTILKERGRSHTWNPDYPDITKAAARPPNMSNVKKVFT